MSEINAQIREKKLPCTKDPEMFYAPEGSEQSEVAKSVCRFCPAKDACLRLALDTKDTWAVMGATTPSERAPMLARRAARDTKRKERDAA